MDLTVRLVDIRRERDIEQLRRVAIAQEAQIHALVRTLRAKCAELAALKGNEKELQQTLALIEQISKSLTSKAPPSTSDEQNETADKAAPKPRQRSGPTEQLALEHVEQLFELDDADKTCPSCGGELRPMSGQFETSEMIDVVEVRYRVVQVKQQKYACKCGGCIETAPGPERTTPGGRYSLDFAIKVALDKYLDHIPLARQERILRRHGLEITTQTLWDQLHALGRRLEKASRALLARVLAEPVVGLDQTNWKRLEVKDGRPWQMWCLTAPGLVVHQIRDDKGAATFKELMAGYHGTIVCDALKTHEAGARGNDDIVLAGCWAHVFRKFEEAAPDHPEAKRALEWIGELYEIDARAADDVEVRRELRGSESAAVLASFKEWVWSQASLKTLSIGNAAGYVVANWDRLTRFVQDARVPLDNNATERAIRGPVVGRKNHYGSRSRRGTEIASIFYSLLETAKLCNVDPAQYLREAALAEGRGEVLLPLSPSRRSDQLFGCGAVARGLFRAINEEHHRRIHLRDAPEESRREFQPLVPLVEKESVPHLQRVSRRQSRPVSSSVGSPSISCMVKASGSSLPRILSSQAPVRHVVLPLFICSPRRCDSEAARPSVRETSSGSSSSP